MNENIDLILFELNANYSINTFIPYDEINVLLLSSNLEYKFDCQLILNFLVKKEMVIQDAIKGYQITLEGRLFILNGGFDLNAEKEKSQKKIQNLKENLLISGTWAAGIGALVLCLIEVLKNFRWVFSINLLTVLFLFLTGILTGISILLITKEVLSRKRNK